MANLKYLAFLTDAPSRDACNEAFAGTTSKVMQGGIGDAAQYLKENASPEYVIVEVPSADAAPALLDKLADVVAPETKVIVTGKIDSFKFFQWLKDIGVHGYLLEPFTAAQAQEMLKEAAPAKAASGEPKKATKVIACMGTRGGVGTTTLIANTGYILATQYKLPTAIVDLDLHFGALALTHDIEPSRGLQDALSKPDRIDGLFLDRVMTKYAENLYLLSAEEPLHEVTPQDAMAAEKLLQALREKYQIILVDLPHVLTPLTRAVLHSADEVIVVSDMSLASLRDVLRIKDYVVDQLRRPIPKVVGNREGIYGKHELSHADFEKHFGAKVMVHVPFVVDIFAAAAAGELAAKAVKQPALQQALNELAQHVAGIKKPAATKESGKSGLGSILKPKKG